MAASAQGEGQPFPHKVDPVSRVVTVVMQGGGEDEDGGAGAAEKAAGKGGRPTRGNSEAAAGTGAGGGAEEGAGGGSLEEEFRALVDRSKSEAAAWAFADGEVKGRAFSLTVPGELR